MKRLKALTAADNDDEVDDDSWGYPKVNIHEKDAERVYLYRGKFTLRLHIARKEFRSTQEEAIDAWHQQQQQQVVKGRKVVRRESTQASIWKSFSFLFMILYCSSRKTLKEMPNF